jgi:hypothetical protein
MESTNYLKMATEHGMKCGEYIATLKSADSKARALTTIHGAAVAFVNHLPLNDIPLERKIQAQFELAGKMAYEGVS